jgi:hypothetical protein
MVTVVVPSGSDMLCVMGAALLGNLTDHFLSGEVKAVQTKSGDGSSVAGADVGVSVAVGSAVSGASVAIVAVAVALATAIADGEGPPPDAFFGTINTKRAPATASSRTPQIARNIGRLDLRAASAAGWPPQAAGGGSGVPQAGCPYVGCAPQAGGC